MKLGQRIRQLRIEKNMTQAQLARQFNLAESTISLYENNKRSPDYEVLQEMSLFFNVSTDFLLGQSTQKSPSYYTSGQNIPVVTDISMQQNNLFTEKNGPFWFGVDQANSQTAHILPGDLLLIDPSSENSHQNALYLVQFENGEFEICTIIYHDLLMIIFSLDLIRKPLVFSRNSQKKLRVIGKVMELKRSFS